MTTRTPAPLAPSPVYGEFFPSLERELVSASERRWQQILNGDGEARADARYEHDDDGEVD